MQTQEVKQSDVQKVIMIRLSPELHAKIKEHCYANRTSIQKLCLSAIKGAIEQPA